MGLASQADIETKDRLEQQREANERLLLALLREVDRADHAEAEKRAAGAREQELQHIAEFRERLIGIVGHDLRNPLNAVLMASGLLVSSGHLAPNEAQLVNRILDASRRMTRIIVHVLEYTRARIGGGFVLDRSVTDVGDVCRRICAELKLTSGRDMLISERGEVTGRWDGELLGEVLSNIVGNAVQHSRPLSVIEIAVEQQGEDVQIAVTNYGPSISADLLPTIFEPFKRNPTESERKSGHLGLGLYISSEIVRAHGGTLTARSDDEVTTFTVRLPRQLTPP